MNGSITSNLFWKFAERITAQLVSFIISLILARILAPDDYGIVAIVMVFITVANVFVSNGLGTALIQSSDAGDLEFSSVFYFNIAFSIIVYILLFIAAPVLAKFYSNEILTPVFRVLGIRIIIAGINSVQQAYVSKKMIFKKFFWSTFIGTFISGVIGLILAFGGYGVWALVAQYLSNTIIDTFVLFLTINWKPKLIFSLRAIGKLLNYGWKILFEGLSDTLVSQIKNLIIGRVYSSSDLGYYSKAQQFPSLLMTNINSSVGAVLFSAMSSEQENIVSVKNIMRHSVSICSYVLFPMLAGLAFVSDSLVRVLLGDKWLASVPFIWIFSFSMLILVGVYPRHQALKAIGRSDIYMNEHIIVRTINVILLLLLYKKSVFMLALLEIIGSALLYITVAYTSNRYTLYRFNEQLKDIYLPVIMTSIMCGSVYAINSIFFERHIIKLIIQIITGIIVYSLLSFIIKPEGFTFCKRKILSIIKRI